MKHHLEKYGLMEREQQVAREKCSGTFSMAWVDVRKAFDTVDHRWL